MQTKKEFNCDICESSEAVELPHAREYTNGQPVHVCCSCGFVYVRQRRSSKDIADEWSNRVYGSNYTAHIPAILARQTYVADYCNVILPLKERKLIDIGSGEGQFLRLAAQNYGANVLAVEPSGRNCEKIRALGYEAFEGTVEEFAAGRDFPAGSADIVTILWTLENCLSCRAMISSAVKLLKPDGKLVVATGSRILVPFKKPLNMYHSSEPNDLHCFRFSANSLQNILRLEGLSPVSTNRYLDHDILCGVGVRTVGATPEQIVRDDYRKVCDFFERWHEETKHYIDS